MMLLCLFTDALLVWQCLRVSALTSALRVLDRVSESCLALPAFSGNTFPDDKDTRSELSWIKIIGVGVRGTLLNYLLVLYM